MGSVGPIRVPYVYLLNVRADPLAAANDYAADAEDGFQELGLPPRGLPAAAGGGSAIGASPGTADAAKPRHADGDRCQPNVACPFVLAGFVLLLLITHICSFG